MIWKTKPPIRAGEDWRNCFAWFPTKLIAHPDGAFTRIWLEPYRERCISAKYWHGRRATDFEFERSCALGDGVIHVYQGFHD